MKNLKEKIEEILRGYFVDKDKDNSWGTPEKIDQLLSLFQEELKKERKKLFKKGIETTTLISDEPYFCIKSKLLGKDK